jgi:hypothetical protein
MGLGQHSNDKFLAWAFNLVVVKYQFGAAFQSLVGVDKFLACRRSKWF